MHRRGPGDQRRPERPVPTRTKDITAWFEFK